MSVFSRLADIVNSNINSILDRAEDPEKIIRLIIQEMEDTLVETRTTAAKTIADKKEIGRTLAQLEETQVEWDRRAELAIGKGREDLARAALLEKSKLSERAQMLADELSRVEEAIARGDSDIAKLNSKLTEAKTKQKAILARQETAGSRLKVRQTLHDGRVDDALARFEQIERKLDEAEGRVESFDLGQRKSLADEIAALEAESAIDAELETLKQRLAARDSR